MDVDRHPGGRAGPAGQGPAKDFGQGRAYDNMGILCSGYVSFPYVKQSTVRRDLHCQGLQPLERTHFRQEGEDGHDKVYGKTQSNVLGGRVEYGV